MRVWTCVTTENSLISVPLLLMSALSHLYIPGWCHCMKLKKKNQPQQIVSADYLPTCFTSFSPIWPAAHCNLRLVQPFFFFPWNLCPAEEHHDERGRSRWPLVEEVNVNMLPQADATAPLLPLWCQFDGWLWPSAGLGERQRGTGLVRRCRCGIAWAACTHTHTLTHRCLTIT